MNKYKIRRLVLLLPAFLVTLVGTGWIAIMVMLEAAYLLAGVSLWGAVLSIFVGAVLVWLGIILGAEMLRILFSNVKED